MSEPLTIENLKQSNNQSIFSWLEDFLGTTSVDWKKRWKKDPDVFLACTMQAGMNNTGDLQAEQDCKRKYAAAERFVTSNSRLPDTMDSDDAASADAREFYHNFIRTCRHRRFFTTSNDWVAVGPQEAQSGNLVVSLFGCKWPIVLRECDEKGTYELVGPAYMFGLMDGEIARANIAAGRDSHVFYIS